MTTPPPGVAHSCSALIGSPQRIAGDATTVVEPVTYAAVDDGEAASAPPPSPRGWGRARVLLALVAVAAASAGTLQAGSAYAAHEKELQALIEKANDGQWAHRPVKELYSM